MLCRKKENEKKKCYPCSDKKYKFLSDTNVNKY